MTGNLFLPPSRVAYRVPSRNVSGRKEEGGGLEGGREGKEASEAPSARRVLADQSVGAVAVDAVAVGCVVVVDVAVAAVTGVGVVIVTAMLEEDCRVSIAEEEEEEEEEKEEGVEVESCERSAR